MFVVDLIYNNTVWPSIHPSFKHWHSFLKVISSFFLTYLSCNQTASEQRPPNPVSCARWSQPRKRPLPDMAGLGYRAAQGMFGDTDHLQQTLVFRNPAVVCYVSSSQRFVGNTDDVQALTNVHKSNGWFITPERGLFIFIQWRKRSMQTDPTSIPRPRPRPIVSIQRSDLFSFQF